MSDQLKKVKSDSSQFVHREDDEIIRFFNYLGGVPRLIFMRGDPIEELKNVIRSLESEKLKEVFSESNYCDIPKFKKGLGRILKFEPSKANLEKGQLQVASTEVLKLVIERFYDDAKSESAKFFASVKGIPGFQQVRGFIQERFMHDTIPKGGLFQLRSLANLADSRLVNFPPCTKATFQSTTFNDLTQLPDLVYVQPGFPNLRSVDAFVILPASYFITTDPGVALVLFQSTVSRTHDVILAGLEAVYKHVCKIRKQEIPLVFLVFVSTNGGIESAQKYVTAHEKIAFETAPPFAQKIVQFTLHLGQDFERFSDLDKSEFKEVS